MPYPTKKISGCLEKISKKTGVPRKKYLKSGGFPVVDQGRDFIGGFTTDESLAYTENLPVIVFGDHTRAIKFIDFPFAVGADGTKVLKPKRFLDEKYFYFALLSLDIESRGYARHFRILKEKEIPLPPLPEQKKIVAKLERVLGKIKETKKLREEAELAAAALLPAELHKIFSEGKRSTVAKAMADKEGWEEINFGQEDYLKIIDGDRGKNYPTKSEFERSGYCLFLNTSNVRHGVFNFDRCDFISKERDEKLRKGKLERGDIVLTTRGTLGNSAFYDRSVPYDNLRINSGMVILRVNEKVISQNFLLHVLNSPAVIDLIKQANSGSAQPQLPIRVFSKLKIPLPPLAEQKKIVSRLDALSAKVQSLCSLQSEQASNFRALKQSILHQAFSAKM